MRSRFFWQLYATYFLLVVGTAGVIGVLIERQMHASLTSEIEARLAGVAGALMPLASAAFSGANPETLPETVATVAAGTGARITLIAPDGRVVADSEQDPTTMANHADRPEIIAALGSGAGASQRFSETVGTFQMYVARAVAGNTGALGVVRVSLPLATVNHQVASVRSQIYRGAGFGIVLALALGIVVAQRMTAPIEAMTRVSEALQAGHYEQRVVPAGFGEIRTLGANLNRLADELTERLARLKQQGVQLDAIIHGMQEGVLALDDQDRIAFSNRAAREALGLTGVGPDTRGALAGITGLAQLVARVRDSGAAENDEIRLTTGGEEIVLDARATGFETEGPGGVVVVFYDITNLRRLEHIRTDFVANVSHELKTPLTAIQGYVETLIDGAVHDPDNNVRFLAKIEQHVRRLSALVSDLLSLARIEDSEQALEVGAIDLVATVTAAAADRRDPIADKQLQLQLDLGALPAIVLAESEGLRQVVDNLLDNAINYTSEGGEIRVSLHTDGIEAQVVIEDTGIGIPEADLDRIFERFYRVDRGRSRVVGGTGLGLSIVRNLVETMNGHVAVRSQVGRGSTFTVVLPLAPK